MYIEQRSKRALAIDRSKNAKTRYSDFNSEYTSSPNTSDVEDYDTKRSKTTTLPENNPAPDPKPFPLPKPVTTTREKPSILTETNTEYTPTGTEKKSLLTIFHKLNREEQHKDLLTTRNVIKSKSDVHKWKENPKYYDIRGVDTQPEELIPARLEIARVFAGNIPMYESSKENPIKGRKTNLAYFQYTLNRQDLGKIIYSSKRIKNTNKEYFTKNRILAHEIGHAYDRNYIGTKLRTGNVSFGYDVFRNTPKSIEAKNLGFGGTNNLMIEIGRKSYNEVWKPVEETTRKLSPYPKEKAPSHYINYRTSREELFADWFSGFITDKPQVKKSSSRFYNMFKKQNKDFFREIRKSDYSITKKYIK